MKQILCLLLLSSSIIIATPQGLWSSLFQPKKKPFHRHSTEGHIFIPPSHSLFPISELFNLPGLSLTSINHKTSDNPIKIYKSVNVNKIPLSITDSEISTEKFPHFPSQTTVKPNFVTPTPIEGLLLTPKEYPISSTTRIPSTTTVSESTTTTERTTTSTQMLTTSFIRKTPLTTTTSFASSSTTSKYITRRQTTPVPIKPKIDVTNFISFVTPSSVKRKRPAITFESSATSTTKKPHILSPNSLFKYLPQQFVPFLKQVKNAVVKSKGTPSRTKETTTPRPKTTVRTRPPLVLVSSKTKPPMIIPIHKNETFAFVTPLPTKPSKPITKKNKSITTATRPTTERTRINSKPTSGSFSYSTSYSLTTPKIKKNDKYKVRQFPGYRTSRIKKGPSFQDLILASSSTVPPTTSNLKKISRVRAQRATTTTPLPTEVDRIFFGKDALKSIKNPINFLSKPLKTIVKKFFPNKKFRKTPIANLNSLDSTSIKQSTTTPSTTQKTRQTTQKQRQNSFFNSHFNPYGSVKTTPSSSSDFPQISLKNKGPSQYVNIIRNQPSSSTPLVTSYVITTPTTNEPEPIFSESPSEIVGVKAVNPQTVKVGSYGLPKAQVVTDYNQVKKTYPSTSAPSSYTSASTDESSPSMNPFLTSPKYSTTTETNPFLKKTTSPEYKPPSIQSPTKSYNSPALEVESTYSPPIKMTSTINYNSTRTVAQKYNSPVFSTNPTSTSITSATYNPSKITTTYKPQTVSQGTTTELSNYKPQNYSPPKNKLPSSIPPPNVVSSSSSYSPPQAVTSSSNYNPPNVTPSSNNYRGPKLNPVSSSPKAYSPTPNSVVSVGKPKVNKINPTVINKEINLDAPKNFSYNIENSEGSMHQSVNLLVNFLIKKNKNKTFRPNYTRIRPSKLPRKRGPKYKMATTFKPKKYQSFTQKSSPQFDFQYSNIHESKNYRPNHYEVETTTLSHVRRRPPKRFRKKKRRNKSMKLLPELKALSRPKNWDVKDFSGWEEYLNRAWKSTSVRDSDMQISFGDWLNEAGEQNDPINIKFSQILGLDGRPISPENRKISTRYVPENTERGFGSLFFTS